jgi:hypothetical protein
MWPAPYREFVEKHGLVGAEIAVPETGDLSGIGGSIRLYDEEESREEAEKFYPGLVVKEDGFVPIGEDPEGSGNPYFINVRDRSPGPVYRIYHDMVADREYDREAAVERVLASYKHLRKFVNE